MAAVQLADTLCGSCACVHSGLDSAHIATNHDGDQTGADLLLANETDICGLNHCVGGFDGADQTTGFDHA